MTKIELSRVHGDFGFEAKDAMGHTVLFDSSAEAGGENFGPRPMHIMLMSLGACSGIDVITILKKQKQEVKDYKMIIKGDRETGKPITLWKNIQMEFHIFGEVDEDLAKRAVQLAMDKYCTAAETLRAAGAYITWKVIMNK